MSELTPEEIKKLCQLCRIEASEEEIKTLQSNLPKILSYIRMLQEVDTEGVEPCSHVLGDVQNVMRPDEVGETMDRDLFLKNSPSHVGGMIRVPPVIKQN